MPGLFDRLSEKLEPDDAVSGLTPMDIVDLEADQRSVMLVLLRDRGLDGMPYEALAQRFESRLPDLDGTLQELIRNGWLVEMGEPPHTRYRVNLRAKRGAGGAGLWSSLNDRLV